MADEGISPEEYERWLTPPQSLASLEREMDHQSAAFEIIARVRRILLRAVAKTTVVETAGRFERADFAALTVRAWPHEGINLLRHRFWTTGTFDHTIDYGSHHQKDFHFYGVRFNPDDIAEIRSASSRELPTAVPASAATADLAPAPARDERKPLPSAERQRFAKLYAGLFGSDATEAKAYLAVQACYPDFKISRDPFLADFRAIRGRQVPGRKAKTGN